MESQIAPHAFSSSTCGAVLRGSILCSNLMTCDRGTAAGIAAVPRVVIATSELLQRYGVKIEVQHVVFGYQDIALRLYNTGTRGDKIPERSAAWV